MQIASTTKWMKEIFDERVRQVLGEKWRTAHDDKHTDGSLANAAACYAAVIPDFSPMDQPKLGYIPAHEEYLRELWPWEDEWNKKHTHGRKKQLVIAGALILAELERLERAGEIS